MTQVATSAATQAATSTATQAPTQPTPTTTTPDDPSTGDTAAASKPVSALLAGFTARITTANMPTAKPEWLAAIQKTDDLGQPGMRADLLNLAALVDEAAKTSDLEALQKMCNLCDADELQQKMTATDSAGRTGFQVLSLVLEQTHPATSATQAEGWDIPGFTSPEKGAATSLDQQDMKLLGVTSPYTGVRAQFMMLDDGPYPYDGWTGFGEPTT